MACKPQEPAHNKQCHNVYFFAGIKRKKKSRIQHHARGFLVFFLPKGESWVTKWDTWKGTLLPSSDPWKCFLILETDKFSVAAVVDCTSLVKSFPVNLYYTLNTQATLNQLCRVLADPSEESQTYTVSAELFNKAGWKGIHSGHLGLLFNVVDEYNFDFVYLR